MLKHNILYTVYVTAAWFLYQINEHMIENCVKYFFPFVAIFFFTRKGVEVNYKIGRVDPVFKSYKCCGAVKENKLYFTLYRLLS